MEWHSISPPKANPSFNKQGGCLCSIPLLEISAVSPDAFWGIWYTFAKPLPLGLAELRRTLRVSNMSWVSNGEGEDVLKYKTIFSKFLQYYYKVYLHIQKHKNYKGFEYLFLKIFFLNHIWE